MRLRVRCPLGVLDVKGGVRIKDRDRDVWGQENARTELGMGGGKEVM